MDDNARKRLRYANDPAYRDSRRRRNQESYKRRAKVVRTKAVMSKFGLTPEAYEAILSSQDRKCAICKTPKDEAAGGRDFSVDHCHETGKIRGLLCTNCNLGLGHFGDDPARLVAALAYLGIK